MIRDFLASCQHNSIIIVQNKTHNNVFLTAMQMDSSPEGTQLQQEEK